ncbi:MAG: hypothetical protein WC378_00910 [Opitutaceae bacterium]|jgi:hypothetical protein
MAFPLPYTYVDNDRSTPIPISQAPKDYPFQAYGDITTCVYSRMYEVWIDCFTPTAVGTEDPLDPGHYLLEETKLEIVRGRIGTFSRTYGNVPLQHTRSNFTLYSRPSVPGAAVLTLSTTWDPPSVNGSNGTTTLIVTIDGSVIGDTVIASLSSIGSNPFTVSGTITAADTATITLTNTGSPAVDLPSGTLKVEVLRQCRNYGTTALGNAGLFYQPDPDQEQYLAHRRLTVASDQGVANNPTGGTAKVGFRSVDSASVAYAVSSANLKTALNAVSKISDFGSLATVTGAYNDALGYLATLNDLAAATTSTASLTSVGSITSSVVSERNGFQQTITLTTSSTYPLASLNVTSGGYYPSGAPTVTISGGGGSGATATVNCSAGVASISVSGGNYGSGYTSAPTVTLTGDGSGATATANAMFFIQRGSSGGAIAITTGGSGYANGANYNIRIRTSGGQEISNSLYAYISVSGGSITSVAWGSNSTIDNLRLPNALEFYGVNGESGTGGTGYATLSGTKSTGSIYSVTLTNPGSGYTSAPTVSFSGGGGSGVVYTAALAGLTVTSLTLTNPGSGYTSQPTITYSSGTATAEAVLTPAPSFTGGTYPVTLFGQTTSGISYASGISTIQTAINALTEVQKRGNATVTGTGWDSGATISFVISFTAETFVGTSSLTPTPSGVTCTPVDGTNGRQQYIKFTGAQSSRLITFAAPHALTSGDKIYVKQGTAYSFSRLDFAIISPTQVSVNPANAPWSTNTAISEGGKYQGAYAPGSTEHRTKSTDTYYMPGVTLGITTEDDIPQTSVPLSDARYLDAVVTGATYVTQSDSALDDYRGSIKRRTKVDLLIPRA